jgi:nucleotide-binding universal stress UspA family protein
MYSNVLLPTDGLGNCVYGTCHGVQLAKAIGAKVTAVCVTRHLSLQEILRVHHPEMDWRPTDSKKVPEVVAHVKELHKELADKALEVAAKMCKDSGVPCEKVFLEDESPADGLLRAAEKNHCDLIFMSTHGDPGIIGSLFGTVASKIIARSKIPVLVHHCGGPT